MTKLWYVVGVETTAPDDKRDGVGQRLAREIALQMPEGSGVWPLIIPNYRLSLFDEASRIKPEE